MVVGQIIVFTNIPVNDITKPTGFHWVFNFKSGGQKEHSCGKLSKYKHFLRIYKGKIIYRETSKTLKRTKDIVPFF